MSWVDWLLVVLGVLVVLAAIPWRYRLVTRWGAGGPLFLLEWEGLPLIRHQGQKPGKPRRKDAPAAQDARPDDSTEDRAEEASPSGTADGVHDRKDRAGGTAETPARPGKGTRKRPKVGPLRMLRLGWHLVTRERPAALRILRWVIGEPVGLARSMHRTLVVGGHFSNPAVVGMVHGLLASISGWRKWRSKGWRFLPDYRPGPHYGFLEWRFSVSLFGLLFRLARSLFRAPWKDIRRLRGLGDRIEARAARSAPPCPEKEP